MAGKVIVTVPTNLIADEAIRFPFFLRRCPKRSTLRAACRAGLADKVMLALDDPEALPKDGNLRGATMRTETGTYHLRPFGQLCIEGFFGGRFAQKLEDAGERAIATHAIDEIVSFLGNDFRCQVKAARGIALVASTSSSPAAPIPRLPGHAGKRARLSAPVDGRPFSSRERQPRREFFSTAHGARIWGEGGGGGVGYSHGSIAADEISADPENPFDETLDTVHSGRETGHSADE